MTLELAHSTSGGGSFDEYALALGLVLLGLAFLVQKSMDRRISILLLVLGLVAFIGSLTFFKNIGGGNTVTVQGQDFTDEEFVSAVAGICAARDEVDDPESAEATFLDRAHGPLHVMAAAIADDDRALAGSLLEAKQGVEEEFAGDTDPEELEAAMNRLMLVSVEVLNALGVRADTC